MKTLKKAISLLTPHERKRGLLVLVLVVGMALLETAGVGIGDALPSSVGQPRDAKYQSHTQCDLHPRANFQHRHARRISDCLRLWRILFIIISAAYRMLTHYVMNRYIEMRRHSISTRLLETYLRQPYAFFLNRHSGDMSKTILSEVDQLIGTVFRPAYTMFAYSLVLIAITALLLMINPWLAFLAAGLLGGLYALAFPRFQA